MTKKRSRSSAAAPAAECSKSPAKRRSSCSDTGPELYVELSGKQKPRPLAWLLRRRPAVKLLSIATWPPSTVALGVESWTCALRACLVPHSASPESAAATATSERGALISILKNRTRGGLNPTGCGYFPKSVQPWLCLKTCQSGLPPGTSESSAIAYRTWVTESKRRSSSLRRMLALRIGGCGSSCWQSPNPMAGGNVSRGGDRVGELPLAGQAKNWPTASGCDWKVGEPPGRALTSGKRLTGEIENWATPQTPSGGMPREGKGPGKHLIRDAQTFPSTPQGEPTGELGLLLRLWAPLECPRLNPVFQWWLMAWPNPGTLLSATHRSSGAAATEWTRWRRRLQSQLCWLMRECD